VQDRAFICIQQLVAFMTAFIGALGFDMNPFRGCVPESKKLKDIRFAAWRALVLIGACSRKFWKAYLVDSVGCRTIPD
jgi:hypothetical protein